MRDRRLDDLAWRKQEHADVLRRFLEVLAVCNTVVPEGDVDAGTLAYLAESPDEAAFVAAARRMGMVLVGRSAGSVTVRELMSNGTATGGGGAAAQRELRYELLATLEFSSARKRMSVVVRDPSGALLLLAKGADSVVMERLAPEPPAGDYRRATLRHMADYGQAGLRTLCLAYRPLDAAEYASWQ
eukprot:SM004732S16635  [mRNA]  locus=s4732:301:1074:- [translate_table: standard]